MNSLKQLLLMILLTGLIVTAVSCKSGSADNETNNDAAATATPNKTTTTNTTTNEAATVITFAVNGWERGLYEERVKDFEEAHPDIKVELISTDEIMSNQGNSVTVTVGGEDDSLVKLVQAADVFSWYLDAGFVSDGLLLNLAPLMEGDDNFNAADYYPGILEQYQWDGGTWAVPTNASYMLIFYDKDLFDKANTAYPEVGWSWDDFIAAAQAATLRDGNEVTQWGFYSQYMDPVELIQAKVGPIFNLDNEPPTTRLEEPEVVAAFQWIIDLYTKYEVSPYAPEPESEEDYAAYEEIFQLIDEGKVAMWPDSAESYAWRSEEHNIGVVPFPVANSENASSPITGWGGSTLAISAGTAHPQAAWEWVNFLTQQNSDNIFSFGSGGPVSLPARRSAAEASGVWDEMDDELAAALRFAVDHGFKPVRSLGGNDKLYQIVSAVIDEKQDVADVLAEAQKAFDSDIQELMEAEAKATPIPAFIVAEPPSSQIEEGDVVVRFVVAGGDTTAFREAAKQFHELHPDIVIKVEEPNFYNEEFSLQSMVGEADAFQWWGPIRSQDELDIVLALQPLLDADPDLTEEDFFPTVLDQFRNQGQVTGLPGEVQIAFLNYNKRLFDAAGRDYPQPGWTLDEFLETAVALTQGDNEEDKIYGYVPDMFDMGDMMAFMARQDATLIDENVDPAMTSFTDPETIAAMRWYTNLTTEYGVKPVFDMSSFDTFGSDPFEERQAMIENDRAAIWKDDQYGAVYYDENGAPVSEEESDNSHVGVVPYPVGKNGASGIESVNGYYIAAQTEVRQAAWEWLKYLTAQESLAVLGLPARVSTAESDEFIQRVGAEKSAIMIASVQNSAQAITTDMFSEGSDWLGPAVWIGLQNAYNSVIAGEATVEEAMQSAQEKADIYRQCIIEKDLVGSNDYQEFESCMKKANLSWEDNF